MNKMTHQFFDFLFKQEYSERKEVIYHVRFKIYREDKLGNTIVNGFLDEELKFVLHKESTSLYRYISIIPKLGREVFISVCSDRTEMPYLISLNNDKPSISDLTYDEIDYYLERFIGGIKGI